MYSVGQDAQELVNAGPRFAPTSQLVVELLVFAAALPLSIFKGRHTAERASGKPMLRTKLKDRRHLTAAPCALVLAVSLVACGDDSDGVDEGGSPESTARAFVDAKARGDCSQQADLASSHALDAAGNRDGYIADCEDEATESGLPEDFEIDEIDVMQETSTHAAIYVSGRSAQHRDQPVGIRHGRTVNLRLEDGSWKVDNQPEP